jgi:hypothetical protein
MEALASDVASVPPSSVLGSVLGSVLQSVLQ